MVTPEKTIVDGLAFSVIAFFVGGVTGVGGAGALGFWAPAAGANASASASAEMTYLGFMASLRGSGVIGTLGSAIGR